MATYYVKNGGNDSASGLDDTNAWAHHPWMIGWTGSTVLAAGDTVCLKCGDSWSFASPATHAVIVGQDGTAGNHIVTTSYSTGNKPLVEITGTTTKMVIYASTKAYITFDNIEVKSSDYHHGDDGGTSYYGFYCINYCHDWLITNCEVHNISYCGIYFGYGAYNIVIGDITKTTTATPLLYSNEIYDCGWAGIFVIGNDSVTLRTDAYVYYNYIHDLRSYSTTFEALAYGISFTTSTTCGVPDYCYARYNYISDIPTWTGLDTHGGAHIYFTDNYLYNCQLFFGCQEQQGQVQFNRLDNLYIERNICEQPQDFWYTTQCYWMHLNGYEVDDPATNIYVRDNQFFYTSRPLTEHTADFCIKVNECDGVIIENNKIYNGPISDCSGGIILSGDGNKNVIIRNNYIEGWHEAISYSPASIIGDIYIYGNIITTEDKGIWSQITGTLGGNIYIYNNVILLEDSGSYIEPVKFSTMTIPVGCTIKVKNNIIGFLTSVNQTYILAPVSILGTFECDYNLYWNSSAPSPYYSGGISKTWAQWNVLGYDTHGFNNTDPLFSNGSGDYSADTDFTLKSGSPGKFAGINVGLATDYFGVTWNTVPSIGVYEYDELCIYMSRLCKYSVV